MVQNRRPRDDHEDVDEIIPDGDDDQVEDSEGSGDESSDEEGVQNVQAEERVNHCGPINHCAAMSVDHSAAMRELIEERDRLREEFIHETRLLQEEIARRDRILEDVRRMEERRRQLQLQRERDLEELAALEREVDTDTEDGVDAGSEVEME